MSASAANSRSASGRTTAWFFAPPSAWTRLPFRAHVLYKQKTAYDVGLGIPAEPLFRSSSLFLRSASISGLRRDAVQPDIEAERKKRDEIEAGKSYCSRRDRKSVV